jgi:redox-sensitive bicupin YhaK (pirin superfamily)
MTAGSGIIHEEMPKGDDAGRMYGFQLWANLAAKDKMCPPRYQEFRGEDIPEVRGADGSLLRLICGTFEGREGPVKGVGIDPLYVDISLTGAAEKRFALPSGRTAFAYVIGGSGRFDDTLEPASGQMEALNRTLVLFSDGDEIAVRAGKDGVRFLLVSGRALREPVAWHGPIVMNTREELETAFEELDAGTFLKNG